MQANHEKEQSLEERLAILEAGLKGLTVMSEAHGQDESGLINHPFFLDEKAITGAREAVTAGEDPSKIVDLLKRAKATYPTFARFVNQEFAVGPENQPWDITSLPAEKMQEFIQGFEACLRLDSELSVHLRHIPVVMLPAKLKNSKELIGIISYKLAVETGQGTQKRDLNGEIVKHNLKEIEDRFIRGLQPSDIILIEKIAACGGEEYQAITSKLKDILLFGEKYGEAALEYFLDRRKKITDACTATIFDEKVPFQTKLPILETIVTDAYRNLPDKAGLPANLVYWTQGVYYEVTLQKDAVRDPATFEKAGLASIVTFDALHSIIRNKDRAVVANSRAIVKRILRSVAFIGECLNNDSAEQKRELCVEIEKLVLNDLSRILDPGDFKEIRESLANTTLTEDESGELTELAGYIREYAEFYKKIDKNLMELADSFDRGRLSGRDLIKKDEIEATAFSISPHLNGPKQADLLRSIDWSHATDTLDEIAKDASKLPKLLRKISGTAARLEKGTRRIRTLANAADTPQELLYYLKRTHGYEPDIETPVTQILADRIVKFPGVAEAVAGIGVAPFAATQSATFAEIPTTARERLPLMLDQIDKIFTRTALASNPELLIGLYRLLNKPDHKRFYSACRITARLLADTAKRSFILDSFVSACFGGANDLKNSNKLFLLRCVLEQLEPDAATYLCKRLAQVLPEDEIDLTMIIGALPNQGKLLVDAIKGKRRVEKPNKKELAAAEEHKYLSGIAFLQREGGRWWRLFQLEIWRI